MFKIFRTDPKPLIVSVQQVHDEIDALEKHLFDEYNDIFSIQENIEKYKSDDKKAEQLKKLGFVNHSLIKDVEKENELKKYLQNRCEELEKLTRMKARFCNQKIMRLEEFEKVLEKYNLIYAPVEHYIKDIPNKNIDEMLNAPSLTNNSNSSSYNYEDIAQYYTISRIDLEGYYYPSVKERLIGKYFSKKFLETINSGFKGTYYDSDISWTNRQMQRLIIEVTGIKIDAEDIKDIYFTTVYKKGLFIAAPKNHFDLKGATAMGKFGYYTGKTFKINIDNDPIVFDHIVGGLIRVITKWGTEDDQSYLDPALINEKMN